MLVRDLESGQSYRCQFPHGRWSYLQKVKSENLFSSLSMVFAACLVLWENTDAIPCSPVENTSDRSWTLLQVCYIANCSSIRFCSASRSFNTAEIISQLQFRAPMNFNGSSQNTWSSLEHLRYGKSFRFTHREVLYQENQNDWRRRTSHWFPLWSIFWHFDILFYFFLQ